MWIKRDDLTGLGLGGNKARKLEYLCAEALAIGADSLVTVGAAQSNHCRTTAAAGAQLGLETHLVLSGSRPKTLVGNQLLAHLFGAHLHYTGAPDTHWGALEIARETLTDELSADGLRPHSIPMGGSTPVGALGYVSAMIEIVEQCQALDISATSIVFTSSSGGTHAGLVAGRALLRSIGQPAPELLAIGVAKGVLMGMPDIATLATDALALIDADGVVGSAEVLDDDVVVDTRWIGDDYGVPTAAGDDAIRLAARTAGLVLDRTYSGKGLAGLLGNVADGRWSPDDDVIFIHTGGTPTVFVPDDVPA